MDTEQILEDYINSIEFDNFIKDSTFNFTNEYVVKQGKYTTIYTIEKEAITIDDVIIANYDELSGLINSFGALDDAEEVLNELMEMVVSKYEILLYDKIREFDKELTISLWCYIDSYIDDDMDCYVEINSAPYIDEEQLNPQNLLEKLI